MSSAVVITPRSPRYNKFLGNPRTKTLWFIDMMVWRVDESKHKYTLKIYGNDSTQHLYVNITIHYGKNFIMDEVFMGEYDKSFPDFVEKDGIHTKVYIAGGEKIKLDAMFCEENIYDTVFFVEFA